MKRFLGIFFIYFTKYFLFSSSIETSLKLLQIVSQILLDTRIK